MINASIGGFQGFGRPQTFGGPRRCWANTSPISRPAGQPASPWLLTRASTRIGFIWFPSSMHISWRYLAFSAKNLHDQPDRLQCSCADQTGFQTLLSEFFKQAKERRPLSPRMSPTWSNVQVFVRGTHRENG